MTQRVDLGMNPRRPIVSGDDVAIEVAVENSPDGDRQNLTGAIATFAVYTKDPDTGASTAQLFAKTVGSGITLTDPVNGLLTIFIEDANTAPLGGDYFHELQIQIAGVVHTAMLGIFRVRIDAIT